MSQSTRRVVLIVDTGVDDALALAFAVRHPWIQLDAVLTSWGNVGLDLVTNNTLRVLDWLGAVDIPVVRGADGPLLGAPEYATYWHGEDGLGGANLPPSGRSSLDDAAGYLIDYVMREPGQVSVVCTGPLTNLALAVSRRPEIAGCVREVVLMGGSAQLPGNTTPVAEFNIYADPEAAAVVFDQSWPLTMVGLDVTRQVALRAEDVRALDDDVSAEATLLREVTGFLFLERGVESINLHDPLAVGVALDPSLVRTLSGPVVVETRGQHTRGQTVFDLRPGIQRPPSNTRVCVAVDAWRFRNLFFTTLGLSPEDD